MRALGPVRVASALLALTSACRHAVSHGELELPAHAALPPGLLTDYASWGRVDDQNRFAPELCMMRPGEGRVSASRGPAAHARKLYYLYAKDRAAYVARPRAAQPVGQVLVKEAFAPEALPADVAIDFAGRDPHGHLVARSEQGLFHPGAPAGLFAMVKLGASDAPGTDAGWVYAVTDTTGAHVERAGTLSDCMSCHERGTTDRLFGVWPE